MRKLLLPLFLMMAPAVVLAQSNQTDTFTIVTYYPSPNGVYRNLRLFPSDQPPGIAQKGVLYYNRTESVLKVYNGTAWVNSTGGAGYWQLNGNNLVNTNSGNVTVNGDLCNSAGICLNQLYNMTSANPLYTPGSGTVHTMSDCRSNGGQVIPNPAGVGLPICQFNNNAGASCPGGWTQYGKWSTTVRGTFNNGCCNWLCEKSHAWSNTDRNSETCSCISVNAIGCIGMGGTYTGICSVYTQMGCY